MGAWLGRRTEPRVDFTEAVRVIWPGEVSGVVARAVNLSPAGMLIDAPTPTPCPVGSDVLCDVTLPRGPRLLRGRVAHRRLLTSAKIGMGIEFIDLSPREAAELRDIVGEGDQRNSAPQRVKVRFAGTNQVVRARAFATEGGFRLATSLPFLKPDTEVDIALAPGANVSAHGWVSSVALEHGHADGIPRLLIDVRVDDPDPWRDRGSALTPVVEPLAANLAEAVPEHVWEPDDFGATMEPAAQELAERDPAAQESPLELEGAIPEAVSRTRTLPMLLEAPGAAPVREDTDQTEIVQLMPRPSRWRALSGGMVAGAVVLALFVLGVLVANKVSSSRPAAALEVAPAAVVAPPAEPTPPEAIVADAPAPVAAHADFTIGLMGSIKDMRRYPLRDPDGVAFNLPHAHASLKLGTYRPDVPGLKSVWVRALAGGGTHLRFFFSKSGPAPRVELENDAVHVSAP